MGKVIVKDSDLIKAASVGTDEFLQVFINSINDAIGGELTSESMSTLNSDQITLLAWNILHEEVMDGGFVQLIHNGYGPFFFKNPFAKAIKLWGMRDLSKLVYNVHSLYVKYGSEIEKDCTDDEFMALFEKYSEFDDMDDAFVENEEQWTEMIAEYVDNNISKFAEIVK